MNSISILSTESHVNHVDKITVICRNDQTVRQKYRRKVIDDMMIKRISYCSDFLILMGVLLTCKLLFVNITFILNYHSYSQLLLYS